MDIKKLFFALVMAVPLSVSTCEEAEAAIPIAKIIQEGVKKVIKAVDLMIQRLQNKTIWLQNAQKVLENKLSELKLKEIAEWTEKHKKLYEEYYEELWKVKNAIETYEKVRAVLKKQVALVDQYKRAWELLRKDKHFTADELRYMHKVYNGILKESIKNLDQMLVVVNSFDTQMTDGKRLEIITIASEGIEQNYFDLQQFNVQNIRLSLSRAKDDHEIQTVKRLYGLNE
jgi:ribosomal protein L31E